MTILRLIPLVLIVLALAVPALGQEAEWKKLNEQAMDLEKQGKYEEGIGVAKRALDVAEKSFGNDHPNVATSLNRLASLYGDQGRYSDAEPLYKRSLEIRERKLGKDHTDVAMSLNNLAELYRAQGRYSDAEPLYKRSLDLWERKLGKDHPNVATSLNNLAALYRAQGRYSDAEPLYKRSLEIRERKLGKDHPNVATSLNNLAELYRAEGRHSAAEPLYKRSLEITETKLGKDHPDVARSLNNLAALYRAQGRYSDAEPLYKRSLDLWERKLGKDHLNVATSLSNLAVLYYVQGRYSDAGPLYKRSLEIRERKLGKDHPDVAISLNNLAALYRVQGRYSDAGPLYKRSLEIRERKLGKDHPDVAISLNSLALLYYHQGRYSDAEPLYKRSLEIREAKLGKDHPDVAESLNNLAGLHQDQGRYSEAEPLCKRSLEIKERKLGKDHPDVAVSLGSLGSLQAHRGDYQNALRMYQEALSIQTKKRLPVAGTKGMIAQLYLDQGDIATAESFLEKGATSAAAGRLHLMKSEYGKARHIYSRIRTRAEENRNANDLFVAHTGLGLGYEGLRADPQAAESFRKAIDLTEGLRSSLPREAREKFFDVRISGFYRTAPYEGLARVLMRMNDPLSAVKASEYTKARAFCERSSSGGADVRFDVPLDVVKQDESLKDQLAALKKARQEAYQENKKDKIAALESQIKPLEDKFTKHTQTLRAKYPLFAATRYPQPMDLSQTALRPEEWVLEYDVTDSGILIYLTHGKEIVKALFKPVSRKEVDRLVRDFREPLEVVPGRDNLVNKLKAFDFQSGKKLADCLLSDVLPVLPEGVPLMVVPDDSLGIIPFEMLVLNDNGEIRTDSKNPCTSGAQFFGDRNPLSYSQSITALTLARTLGKSEGQGDRMLVMADPVYKLRDQRAQQAGSMKAASVTDSYIVNLMAAIEDSSGGRMGFNRLPLTGELAERLGGMFSGKAAVYTGLAATRDNFLKKIAPDMKPYRSIVFAAHGYFGTQIPGVMEPVLVLTTVPPGTDGFLRMSEIMGLRMNADVVALTACQTGLGRHISGEGTMGMGRAFQYAGAKSVLMSLWSVAENSSVMMVESFFKHLKEGKPKLEALKLARQEIRQAGYDHPFYWAPFILVGEVD